jgi:calcineurin-like phosphoesterase family protein
MIYFTADEHYGHPDIIKYCNRPFRNVSEMDKQLIANHNKRVRKTDTVIHLGDFCVHTWDVVKVRRFIRKLNGKHIFLKGSHDNWLSQHSKTRLEGVIRDGKFLDWCWRTGETYLVLDHYAMLRWPRSYFNSWQLFGHSHGTLHPEAKQYDVGVDNNLYFPVSWDDIKLIMKNKPDNPNYVKEIKLPKKLRIV